MDTHASNLHWCHVCERQFRTSSALFQHGKRLSHLKRAMRISSSRCTTITNGRITSSVQRPKSSSTPIAINALTVNDEIIIRRTRHNDDPSISYTCDLCSCRCWSIRNIHRHVRLHADVRPFTCDLCQLKFKSYGNLMKHFKTSRHQLKKENNERNWSIDAQAMNEQNKLVHRIRFIDNEPATESSDAVNKLPSLESDNLLEDLHIPDSQLIDGDAAELALIDPGTFEELHKAAECLLNLQGVFYFGEDEHVAERSNAFLPS